jgi:hypothetical protein
MDAEQNLTFRRNVAQVYRDVVIDALGYKIPPVGSAEELLELARKAGADALEAANGWRTEPPFPGAGEKPEEMPRGWRMICASKFFVDDTPMGTIYMTFVSGRPVSVIVNPPDYPIPKEYLPIISR